METKHTPVPWQYLRMHLGPKDKDRRCGFVINGPDINGDDFPTRICDLRVPSGINGFTEGEANARLIAAAPDLLDALTLALATIERLKPPTPYDSTQGTRDVINAAIAKAESK